MMQLLVFKEHLKNIYSKYSTYIDMAIKVVAVIAAMITINVNVGFMPRLKSPVIVILLGVMAAFLPNGINVLLLTLIVVAHLYSLSTELAVIVAVILMVMYLLYFRFAPKDSYVIILLPVLFFIKIPYIMPLVLGLIATPVSIVSMAFGIIIYFTMLYAKRNASTLTNVTDDSGINKITNFLEAILKNKEMWIMIIAFAVVILLVYFIKRLSIEHSWAIAVVVGGIADLLILLISELVIDTEASISIGIMIVMSLLSVGIVYLLHFMILSVDYSRTEYVQFEDDEYYYYVKAVPKINVTTQNVKVKRINAAKSRNIKK
ncbi:MAG: ABC transporter permease [Lachnospiraceae bacterium]|nr:ABC transporter permease [Lachnospiraceae bacterium]